MDDHDIREMQLVQRFLGERVVRLETQSDRFKSQFESESGTLQRTHKRIFETLADHDNKLRGNGSPGFSSRIEKLEDFMNEIKWYLRKVLLTAILGFAGIIGGMILMYMKKGGMP